MQMREILVGSAVDDQPVTVLSQLEFLNQALYCAEQVGQKNRIHRVQIFEAGDSLLRDEQNMEWICWLWMVKGQQRIRLAQAFDRNGETHVGEYPTNET